MVNGHPEIWQTVRTISSYRHLSKMLERICCKRFFPHDKLHDVLKPEGLKRSPTIETTNRQCRIVLEEWYKKGRTAGRMSSTNWWIIGICDSNMSITAAMPQATSFLLTPRELSPFMVGPQRTVRHQLSVCEGGDCRNAPGLREIAFYHGGAKRYWVSSKELSLLQEEPGSPRRPGALSSPPCERVPRNPNEVA
jgi:hypothetical protein